VRERGRGPERARVRERQQDWKRDPRERHKGDTKERAERHVGRHFGRHQRIY